jgi:hypothetical protein
VHGRPFVKGIAAGVQLDCGPVRNVDGAASPLMTPAAWLPVVLPRELADYDLGGEPQHRHLDTPVASPRLTQERVRTSGTTDSDANLNH